MKFSRLRGCFRLLRRLSVSEHDDNLLRVVAAAVCWQEAVQSDEVEAVVRLGVSASELDLLYSLCTQKNSKQSVDVVT